MAVKPDDPGAAQRNVALIVSRSMVGAGRSLASNLTVNTVNGRQISEADAGFLAALQQGTMQEV